MGKVATKNAPDLVRRLSDFYSAEKDGDETLADVVHRVGKARLKSELGELVQLPTHDENPEFYRDSRQPWDYTKNIGVGECAGAVVDQAEFMLEDADRLNFEASLALDEGRHKQAAELSYQAVTKAADGILFTRGLLLSDKYDTVKEFRSHFYDTGAFWKPFAENFFRTEEEGIDVQPRASSTAGRRGDAVYRASPDRLQSVVNGAARTPDRRTAPPCPASGGVATHKQHGNRSPTYPPQASRRGSGRFQLGPLPGSLRAAAP